MVLITDKESSNSAKLTVAAGRALNLGIHVFAVGVTSKIKETELLLLTGGDQSRVFTMNSFQDLNQLLSPVTLKVCSDC